MYSSLRRPADHKWGSVPLSVTVIVGYSLYILNSWSIYTVLVEIFFPYPKLHIDYQSCTQGSWRSYCKLHACLGTALSLTSVTMGGSHSLERGIVVKDHGDVFIFSLLHSDDCLSLFLMRYWLLSEHWGACSQLPQECLFYFNGCQLERLGWHSLDISRMTCYWARILYDLRIWP